MFYRFWRPEQPDNWKPTDRDEDCVHLTFKENMHGKWNDFDCNNFFRWVCKKKLG